MHRRVKCARKLRHFRRLRIIQRDLGAQEARHINLARASRYRNRHTLLVSDGSAGNNQIGFAHDKGIRRDRAADNALPQSPTGVDHDFIAIAGDWIGTEDHCGDIRRDQLLNKHSELQVRSLKALAGGDSPVRALNEPIPSNV